jgi:UDP-N-acetylglucosamine--N-acetylmuramyl-(pentapeptide) pyrophosphoryl-undecaprenol N-acetylglucosamine transferase
MSRTWSSWRRAPAATSSRAWRWRARCRRAAGASAGWAPRHGMENQLVPKAGIPLDTIGFSGLRGKGLLHTADRRAAPAQGLLGLPGHPAPARRQRGAGHGRLCVLSRRADGLAAGQAADAGECRRRAAAVQQGAAAGGRPRGLRLRRRCRARRTKNAVVTGNPVRAEIEALPAPEPALAGRSGPLRLLVVGGSLGAQVLNRPCRRRWR